MKQAQWLAITVPSFSHRLGISSMRVLHLQADTTYGAKLQNQKHPQTW